MLAIMKNVQSQYNFHFLFNMQSQSVWSWKNDFMQLDVGDAAKKSLNAFLNKQEQS